MPAKPATNLETTNISDTYYGLLHAGGTPVPSKGQARIRDGSGTVTALSLGANCNGATICGTLSATTLAADALNIKTPLPTSQINILDLVKALYPVNSVIYTTNGVNPGTRSGWSGTTWTQIAKGRFIVGVGEGVDSRGDDRSFAAGETYGEYFHVLTEKEMPSHRHGFTGADGDTGKQSWSPFVLKKDDAEQKHMPGSAPNSGSRGILDAGSDDPHNNMPPGYALWIWQRTA
jgi:hypothetical protein